MAERLEVAAVVGSALGLGDDVIDIDGGGGEPGGEAVSAERLFGENGEPELLPCPVVAS